MSSQIVCALSVLATNITTTASLITKLAAVPIDYTTLNFLGLTVSADSTAASGNNVTRTFTLAMNPGTPASVVVTLDNVGTASPVSSIGLTAPGTPGSGYSAVPQLTFSGGPNIDVALAHALGLSVVGATITASGAGYTAATPPTVTFVGGLSPGGVQATATANINGGGHITGLTILTAGGPYYAPPTVVFDHGSGTGGAATALMGLSGVQLDHAGAGYHTTPTVTVTPMFHVLYPDAMGATAQGAPLADWMVGTIAAAMNCAVSAAAPVVT